MHLLASEGGWQAFRLAGADKALLIVALLVALAALGVSYVLTKDDAPTFKKSGLLYPVAAKNGPHYAAATELAGAGTYRLTYIVSPPSSHGMLRQIDKTNGVPDWWKPINASWTFTYPQNKN